jgi:hypothetical protein
MAEVVEE